jgi:CO/xanthine dehydrogenase FAD-binding subunit
MGVMRMIIEYHRPQTLAEALSLLARETPVTIPIGGGSAVAHSGDQQLAVVDLQALGLNAFQFQGSTLELGATLSLQALLEIVEHHPETGLAALKQVIQQEAAFNLRQIASIAGALVSSDGRSPFTTALLALDAVLQLEPGGEQVSLGDVLPLRRQKLPHRLITKVRLPTNAQLAYETVARSPLDKPIVCTAAVVWPSGRARLALGGYGEQPLLVLDGTEADGAELAASSAYSQAGDAWASAEYRSEVAGILAHRAVLSITS